MAAPQLRLEVSLNLAGFRSEVRKLTQIAQSEFNPLLKVNVDTKDYRAQLKALERIRPVIKIEDSQLDAARARLGTLNKSLATLRRATSTPIEIKLKYVEVGKPPSAAAGQIGQAVSGRVRADQAVAALNQKQAIAARNMLKAADVPVSGLGKSRSLEAYRKSIIDGMTNAGKESIAGLAQGLKDGQSAIGQAAKTVGKEGVRAIKDTLGIASPSRVFRQIGEFSVDGLELGFLNGLKDFKSKSVAEIRKIVALMRLELAKVSDLSGTGGASVGSLRQRLVGQRAYTSPIGPLPVNSRQPYAQGTRGQFGYSGYEPRMVSRPYGQPLPAQSNSFLALSRSAAQVQPSGNTPGSFLGFSQRAAQITQASGGGGSVPPVPPVPPRGGGGSGSFGGMRLNVPQLPGSGVVRELGQEFGFAAKQVLLFGSAYKALAFLQGFPSQVGSAVSALQSFRNTLNAITPSAADAAASNQLIIDTVDKYNIPIESAREGFTRLYASMKPAGFSGEQIGDLFLGISKASATLGLSREKVDRVTYAFSQMASKGQLMAEEVTGQLGDVIPGALSIMAEAANMDIKTFKKAMEDGMFVGKAFETVMSNVPIVLEKRFGKGAEGAAKTFQGALNDMQTSLTLFYEAFEPVAVGFLNAVVKPMTDGLQTITEGVRAYFQGQKAATPEAENFNNVLKTLVPSLGGIAQNIGFALKQLLPLAQIMGAVVVQITRFLALPFMGYLAGTYLQVVLLTSGFKLLATSGLGLAILATIQFIRQGILAASVMTGLRVATQQTTLATVMFGKTLQTVMIKSVIGIALVAIGALIAKIMELRGQLSSIGNDAKGMEDLAKSSARMGDVEGTKEALGNIKDRLATFKELQKELKSAQKTSAGGSLVDDRGAISTSYQISTNTAKKLVELGVLNAKVLTKTSSGYSLLEDQMLTVNSLVNKNVDEFGRAGQKGNVLIEQAIKKGKTQKVELQNIDLSAGKEKSLESYYGLQDQLAKAQTQADIDRLEAAFEHARAMVNAEYDLKEAKANSFQKKAIAFQKEIFAITSEQDAALFKNRNKVLAATGSVAGGAGGGAPVASSGYIDKSVLRTFLVSQGFGRTTGDYTNKGHATPNHTLNAMDMGILGGSDADALRRTIAMERQLSATGAFGNQLFGPERDPYGHGAGKGGQNIHLHIPTPGGKVKMTPGLADLMNYSGLASPGVTPGKIAPSVKRDKLAEQQVALTAREANAADIEKEAEAIAKLEIATANYVQSLVPTAEQALQNQLLQQRITLTQNSFSPEILEAQLAFAEQELQVTENIKRNTEEINRLTAAGGNNAKGINALTDANNQLKANLPVSAIQLYSKAINEQVLSLAQRNKTAMQDAVDQERVNNLIIGGMTRQAAEAKVTAENLRGNYKKALEEATRQVEIAAAAEEVLAAARRLGGKETEAQTAKYNALAQALKDAKKTKEDLKNQAPNIEKTATNTEAAAVPKTASSYIADGVSAAQERLAELTNTGYQVVQAANAIGDAFGTAFKGLVSGSMTAQEALAGMFQSIADHFADMVAQMIAEYLKMALIKGLGALIGGMFGGGGGFTPLSNEQATSFNFNPGAMTGGTPWAFANGGIAPGGFTAFANGGMVTGPTMGLVGEGRYNEAIVPLPDGKSIPVQLAGGGSSSPTVIVNVDAKGSQVEGNEQNANQLGRVISAAVQTELIKQQRPGGLLAR